MDPAASCTAENSGPAGSAIVTAAPAPKVVKRFVRQQVPADILENQLLNEAVKALPSNYNFEIHKTVWRIRQTNAKTVALQFPEGLLLFSCVIADILQQFADVEHTFILGDVTYGACCVDDFSAAALGAGLLVHYGHSCLVPVDVTSIPCLYVFVDITFDVPHLVDTICANFSAQQKLVLAGTIQFCTGVNAARQRLQAAGHARVDVPQVKPLSPGETLGCTAPIISSSDVDAIVFVADGRFHLESIMIANPATPAYRYDPYSRLLTREAYDQEGMRLVRRAAIDAARHASRWGLVLGTLGRQGNPALLEVVEREMALRGKSCVTVLMSEVSPRKLDLFEGQVEAWVQVACPRLSIDWGEGFAAPTLTPYEALVALGAVTGWWQEPRGPSAAIGPYPMDYYAANGGEWSSSYHRKQPQHAGTHDARLAPGGSTVSAHV